MQDASPKSWSEKAGAALPIALTALSTTFAGLSTGELQKAMYWRSYAAQDQGRATGQWTLAGFKRDRALICQAAAAQLRAAAPDQHNPFAGTPPDGADPTAVAWLAGNGPPKVALPEVADEPLKRLLDAIRQRTPDAELAQQAESVKAAAANAAIDEAERAVEDHTRAWTPTLQAASDLAAVGRAPAQAAFFDLEHRRYRAEAGLNQGVGYLYDARVRVSGVESDRHQRKSRQFFYAMLAAQVGATVSALALARQKRSVLWAVAGGTGGVAVAIAASVYLSDV